MPDFGQWDSFPSEELPSAFPDANMYSGKVPQGAMPATKALASKPIDFYQLRQDLEHVDGVRPGALRRIDAPRVGSMSYNVPALMGLAMMLDIVLQSLAPLPDIVIQYDNLNAPKPFMLDYNDEGPAAQAPTVTLTQTISMGKPGEGTYGNGRGAFWSLDPEKEDGTGLNGNPSGAPPGFAGVPGLGPPGTDDGGMGGLGDGPAGAAGDR